MLQAQNCSGSFCGYNFYLEHVKTCCAAMVSFTSQALISPLGWVNRQLTSLSLKGNEVCLSKTCQGLSRDPVHLVM